MYTRLLESTWTQEKIQLPPKMSEKNRTSEKTSRAKNQSTPAIEGPSNDNTSTAETAEPSKQQQKRKITLQDIYDKLHCLERIEDRLDRIENKLGNLDTGISKIETENDQQTAKEVHNKEQNDKQTMQISDLNLQIPLETLEKIESQVNKTECNLPDEPTMVPRDKVLEVIKHVVNPQMKLNQDEWWRSNRQSDRNPRGETGPGKELGQSANTHSSSQRSPPELAEPPVLVKLRYWNLVTLRSATRPMKFTSDHYKKRKNKKKKKR